MNFQNIISTASTAGEVSVAEMTGDHGFGGMSADAINSMNPTQFANGIQHAPKDELRHVAFDKDVSKDKAIAALDALESMIPPSKTNPADGDFGDDTPEEKLKKLIHKLKDKLASGVSLNAEDKKDLHEANTAVADSKSTTETSTKG